MPVVIRLRALIKRRPHRGMFVALLAALCMLLAWEHGGFAEDHMGEAVSICLAVVESAAILVAGGATLRRARRPRPPRRLAPRAPLLSAPLPSTPARARAGPASLQVFLR